MSNRNPIIAANWKMYKTGVEAETFIRALKKDLPNPSCQVFIAPPFTALPLISRSEPYVIGAQNMHEAEEGAYTGEISATMLKDAGARFVILGHSERRRLFHETDERIHLKLKQALTHHLLPILCVGETLEKRQEGKTFDVLAAQLKTALGNIPPGDLVIAYEPVWAIGTGKTATPEIAQEAHRFCRGVIEEVWGKKISEKTPILYGGSVTPETASGLALQPDIDGALVGGASLDVTKFIKIIQGFNP